MTEQSGGITEGQLPRTFWERPEVRIWMVLGILILLVYGQVGTFRFCRLDDGLYIFENPKILRGLGWESTRYAFTSFDDSSYLPLVWLSHAACVSLFGLHAGGHHLVNVGIHLLNSILLFEVLRRATRDLWPSALVAFLFAFHPLHVESVAWIAERKDVLSTFFWLCTTLAYLSHRERPGNQRLALMVLFFVLGLLSKSMLVTLPLTLVLLDVWPLRDVDPSREGWSVACTKLYRSIWAKWHLWMISAAAALLTILASKGSDAFAFRKLDAYPVLIGFGNAALSLVKYLFQTFWPLGLSPYYPHPGVGITGIKVAFAISFLSAVTVLCFQQVHKRPYLLVGWAWYLITVLPVIGILQVGLQGSADRYTYIPLIGIFVMLAWLGQDCLTRWHPPRVAVLGIGGGLLVTMLFLTMTQVSLWKDSRTLFTHAARLDPDNWMAHHVLGDLHREEGRLEEALDSYLKAEQAMPGIYQISLKIGITLRDLGKTEAALECFERARIQNPHQPGADQLMGGLLIRAGRFEAASVHIARAMKASPSSPQSVAIIEAARIDWGVLLRLQQKRDLAAAWFSELLQEDPSNGRARLEYALTLVELGRLGEAIGQVRYARQVLPANPQVLDLLCWLCIREGRYEEGEEAWFALQALDAGIPTLGERRRALNTLKAQEQR